MKKYLVDEKQTSEIENSFTYHAVKDDQQERYVALRNMAKEFAILILENTPKSRGQSVAITKLEECVMWANKSIACGE